MAEKKELNFEETMETLEQIVQELEKGDLNLDDSIAKFEEGVALSKNANKYLEEAEKKITMLVSNEDGDIKEEDFNS